MRRWITLIWIFCLIALAAWAATGHGPITLAWDAVTQDENNNSTTIAYYNVRWGTASLQQTGGIQVAPTSCTAGTCQVTVRGLDPAQQYWFVVTSVNNLGESVASNEVQGRPSIVIHR